MKGLLNFLNVTVLGYEMKDVTFYILLGVAILLVLFLIGVIGSKIDKKKKQN
ncbi:MAG: hypothetical protein PHN54_02425 [Bacilli bacterium]|nr:hypothetical protein [Bacilli bacterium]